MQSCSFQPFSTAIKINDRQFIIILFCSLNKLIIISITIICLLTV